MRILIVSEKDAANQTLGIITNELKLRGHDISIYALYNEKSLMKYFSDKADIYTARDIKELSLEKEFDCIITCATALRCILEAEILTKKIPIFCHSYIIDGTSHWRGDINSVPSILSNDNPFDKYLDCTKIGIGEPKYDKLPNLDERSNRILFIDSGHYPFSSKGKTDLAKCLLKICHEYPDHEVVIKPRFLKSDKIVTHKNDMHIYDYIEKECDGLIPTNLNMLKEHLPLNELVQTSHVVICMQTSAYVAAIAMGKGLIVLDGFESEDIYDVRQKNFDYTKILQDRLGIVTDYNNVCEHLPDGIKVSESEIKLLLAETENSTAKICDMVETYMERFFSKGLFPVNFIGDYSDREEMLAPEDSMTWERYIERRVKNTAICMAVGMISFRVNATLDCSEIAYKIWNTEIDTDEKDRYGKLRSYCSILRDECICKNADIMSVDSIDAGSLLNAYYLNKMYNEILAFPDNRTGAYHLFRGFVYEDMGNYSESYNEILEYFDISKEIQYIREISDMSGNRSRAYSIAVKYANDKATKEKFIEGFKQYYAHIYGTSVNEKFENCLNPYRYIRMKWDFYDILGTTPNYYPDCKFVVYGAGKVLREIILKSGLLKDRIEYIIDAYSNDSNVDGLLIKRPDELANESDGKTVVVTIIAEYDSIKKSLLEINNTVNVIPIVEI